MKKIIKKKINPYVPPPNDGNRQAKRNPLEQWRDNPTSLRKSINAKCYECNGEENPTNRAKYCNIFDCPLWNVRPYSKGISKEQCEKWNESQ